MKKAPKRRQRRKSPRKKDGKPTFPTRKTPPTLISPNKPSIKNNRSAARKTAFLSLIAAEEETLAKIQSEASDKARIDWLDLFAEKFKAVDAKLDDVLMKQRPKPVRRRWAPPRRLARCDVASWKVS